jgi:holliday junction DNA helicase RuvA
MIAYLKGILAHAEPTHVVVECAGVGYAVRVSLNTYLQLQGTSQTKGQVWVHTYLQTKEDGQTLFGFAEPAEKELFELLLGVQGVGGALALAVLSAYSPDETRRAIAGGDSGALKRVKGVGQKTAERIVLELRDKVGATTSSNTGVGVGLASAAREEALQALATLGYPKQQAGPKVDAYLRDNPGATAETLIKAVLRSAG